MNETWFIGDTHFGHKNILLFEKEARPFETIEDMNEAIIDRWNNCVRDNDTVYHLGDFAFGRHNIQIAERLRGKKRLILGNHDSYPCADYLRYFDKVYGCTYWERCVLTHMPVHANGLGSRWMVNVHGHLHSRVVMSNEITAPEKEYPMNWCVVPDKNYFNVSCEQNNLTPIHADLIRERIKEID